MQLSLFPSPAPEITHPQTLRNYMRPQWIGEHSQAHAKEPIDTAAYWFANIATNPLFDPDKEHLAVILLNTKYRAIAWNLIAVGSLNCSECHPREILRPAIAAAAYGAVVMHNHPSGDTTPSSADAKVTHQLKQCFDLMMIRLVDHVIVGRKHVDGYHSFLESGLLH